MLETDGDTSEELITFHVKMLRKLKKSVSMDKWEKVLTRYIAVIACLAAIISLIPSVLSRVSEPGYPVFGWSRSRHFGPASAPP